VLKTAATATILIALLAMLFAGCGGDSSRDRRADGTSREDVEHLLIDAADMLERTAPEPTPAMPQRGSPSYEYGEPSDLSAYASGAALPGVRVERPDRETTTSDTGETSLTSQEAESYTENSDPDWRERPWSNRESAWSRDEDRDDQSPSTPSQPDISEFYSDVHSWSSGIKTAAETRRKAAEIRQEAESIRRQAETLPPEDRQAALDRARTMDNYADRISSTRGNTRKLNILRHELSGRLDDN